MPDGLRIGKAGRRVFTLPPDIATRATAVHGIRGSGKTVTASVIAEELLKLGSQVVIVDPTDAWWGLKSSLDGSKSGFPVVVLGGEHGDLPIEHDGGRAVADFAVEHRVPLVLAVRHFRKAKQRQFVKDFAEQVYHRKGATEYRTPLTIIIDEASTFIPQRVMGDVAVLVGAIEDLVRRGRNSGIGVVLIDQRPASVNKDVLTQAELLISHRITGPHDRKALDEWIRQHDTEDRREAFLEDLASLPQGEAYFWAPGIDVFERVAVRMRETFDSSATPKPGEAPLTPQAFADVDLELLREQLAETVAAAEENDPKALRARITELESELGKTRKELEVAAFECHDDCWSGGDLEREIEVARREVKEEAWSEAIDATQMAVMVVMDDVGDRIISAIGSDDDCPPLSPRPARNGTRPVTSKQSTAQARSRELQTFDESQSRVSTSGSAVENDLPGAQRRILDALVTLESIGVERVSRQNLAVFSRQSPKSSAYQAHVAKLEQGGLVTYPAAGEVSLTPDGRGIGSPSFTIRSAEDLHEAWFAYLNDPQTRILRALLEAHPADVDRDELAGMADQSHRSSAYQAHVATLQQLGAVEYPQPGRVRASELLFPARLG